LRSTADLDDDRTRVIWAEDGRLCRAQLGANGLKRVTSLYDFNPMTFEPLAAPY
jgi:hypothetical protein